MNRTALVVDDSMLIRHTVCRWLEEHGFTVQAACNGEEALRLLSLGHPDLIITDLQMPGMSGHELIDVIKNDPTKAHIPIVVLSGKLHALKEIGPNAHAAIVKDIDIVEQLKRAVTELAPA